MGELSNRMEMSKKPRDYELLGLPLHNIDVPELLAYVSTVICQKKKAIVLNLNIYCVNLAAKHPWLFEFIKQAHLVTCDGDGIRWGLWLLGYSKIPPKITYNVYLWQLAEFCAQKGYRIFLLGGMPGIAEKAAERLKAKNPSLQIAGTHHGHFNKTGVENDEVIQKINQVSPDILLVCFGMPIQERWIRDHWKRIQTFVFLKGGAALDYAAGKLEKAPGWVIRLQLEWLFRFFQDPVRLFTRYVIGNPYFIFRILLQRIKEGKKEP